MEHTEDGMAVSQYDQRAKAMGMPTSDEIQKAKILENFKQKVSWFELWFAACPRCTLRMFVPFSTQNLTCRTQPGHDWNCLSPIACEKINENEFGIEPRKVLPTVISPSWVRPLHVLAAAVITALIGVMYTMVLENLQMNQPVYTCRYWENGLASRRRTQLGQEQRFRRLPHSSRSTSLETFDFYKAFNSTRAQCCCLASPRHKPWMLSLLFPVDDLGGNLPSSFPEALSVNEENAKGGDPAACATMGTLYLHGWGVPQDFKVARDYFIGARNRGHARGFTGMGILLVHGWGGEAKDYMEAAKQLRIGVDRVRRTAFVISFPCFHGEAVVRLSEFFGVCTLRAMLWRCMKKQC